MHFSFHFLKRPWFWIVAVILLIVGGIFLASRNKTPKLQTASVTRQDLVATVLATGQVTSAVDLSLAFQSSGFVQQVHAVEGQIVKKGQLLAVLDQASARATLTQAQGVLAQAQANLDKIQQGSSNEQVAVAQTSLTNAQANLVAVKAQQETLVSNARSALFNTRFTAVPGTANLDATTVTISGTYTGVAQGAYRVELYATGSGLFFTTSGLEEATGSVTTQPVPLGKNGLFISFSTTAPVSNDVWTISVPNTTDATYVTNKNAYDAAVRSRDTQVATAEAQVSAAEATLAQVRAQATSADVNVARAQVLSAQGQVEAAQAALNHTVLSAPANGTITKVNIKVGEQASALAEAMVLQDVNDLHAEAQVSEADIASLAIGQTVDYTFDALGPDRHFSGIVSSINPASTVISGVVDYKVTANIVNIPEVKPGMTANMTILAAEKKSVLAVPSATVINRNGTNVVRVVDDAARGTFHEVPVKTGLFADGGLVEITDGLTEGQTVVIAIGK